MCALYLFPADGADFWNAEHAKLTQRFYREFLLYHFAPLTFAHFTGNLALLCIPKKFLQLFIVLIHLSYERIAALIASHTQHANFQFGAHIEIKEKLDDVIDSLAIKQKAV